MTDRILIVREETPLAKVLASALTKAGFAVDIVADYFQTLLKIDEFKPDIAIVDEVLAGGDGLEVCSLVNGAFGIPVILLGEDCSGKAWMRAVEAGADFYFRNPFSYLELVARVRAILRRYKKATA